MDKYTYGLKTDKIQKLVRQEDYETAAKISDTMEWPQEHNVRLLTAAAEAYENVDRLEEATELLLRAYENSTAGKRILYKLTELALLRDKMDDAETFYRKYLEEAQDDSNRFILRYKIAEAKDEPLQRKIDILEAYHKYEFEEEWACELAELYCVAEEREKCVKLCDKIILWFGVGDYVRRAMELKETFEPLTEEQRDKKDNPEFYEDQIRRIAEEIAQEEAMADADEEPEEAAAGADPQDHLDNYTASVDLSVIQEIMDEEPESQFHPGEEDDMPMGAVDVVPVEDEIPAEEVPEEEAPAEETPVEEEDPMSQTKDLQSTPGWQDMFRQPVEGENADPTKEIVIPGDYLKTLGTPANTAAEAEPVVAAAENVLAQAQDDVPVISMDEIEQTELEHQLDEAEPAMTVGFHHDRCIFIVNGENTTDPAVDALDSYYAARRQEMSPVAKILGEKLNNRGLIHSMPQLNHKDLIIAQAGKLSDKLVKELLEVLDYLDTDKVFVLMDQEDAISELKLRMLEISTREPEEELPPIAETEAVEPEVEPAPEPEVPAEPEVEAPAPAPRAAMPLVAEDEEESAPAPKSKKAAKAAPEVKAEKPEPEAVKTFENLAEDQELSQKDFIAYAEAFAKELECVIDESGYDALEEEMDAILKESGRLTAGDVEDLIEDAADQAEKMTMRRMFSSKYNKEGFLILRKRNFH